MRVRLERRQETPAYIQIILPIAAVAATLILCSVLVALSGVNVLDAYRLLLLSAFETTDDLLDTLVKASPLLFTGLAVAVAFRAKFWNIGAEGQLMAGACAASFIGEQTLLPGFSLVPLMILGSALVGALFAVIPAILKVKLKVDDVVTTLLLNSIILYGVMALLEGPWKDPKSGYPNSPVIRSAAEYPILAGYQLHLGVLLSVIAALVMWWIMKQTTLGFSIRAVGENPNASRYAGLPVGRVILIAALISGALAGLAGAGEIAGVRYRVTADLSSGYGYAGIVVATLGELNPLGVVPAALFFAVLFNGAGTMARTIGVPIYLADVIQGVALLTMVAGRLFTTYRFRLVRPSNA